MLTLRPATFGDAEFLYGLRNDAETVNQSQNRSTVQWPDHCKWLDEALADDNRLLYVATEDGKEVGTGRLDIYQDKEVDDDCVELSITVAPGARGRGVAKRIIAELIKAAEKEAPYIQIAHVRENNIGSMIAFLKAGFIPTSDRIVRTERK